MLSRRGRKKAGEPLRPDFALFERAQENPYADDNREGAITLCIAENLLQWPTMRDKLGAIAANTDWPEWLAAYSPLGGQVVFRQAVATFVGTHIAGTTLSADHFCGSAGATAVVELTALCLGDPGDYAVFPAPAYQAYRPDVNSKAGLERYDIQTYAQPPDGPFHPLSVTDLDRSYRELGERFRLLVLTQPDNPTGAVYSEEQLTAVADWCVAKKVHLVVNEIYALSQFDRGAGGIANEAPYTSFLPLLEQRRSPYLHWWYSFSKDFGISGFRVGLLYSRNEELLAAYTNFNAPHQIANPVQWLLSELLGDDRWVSDYRAQNRRLLTEAYTTVTGALDGIGVPYAHARGSLFVWADFSNYLPERSRDEAQRWWERLYEQTGVLLTAPGGLGQTEEGWFRIVYSGVSQQALEEAMSRINGFCTTG